VTTSFKLKPWGLLAVIAGIGGGALALRAPVDLGDAEGWRGVTVSGSAGDGVLRWIDAGGDPFARLAEEASRLEREGFQLRLVPGGNGGGILLGRTADRWARGVAWPRGQWGGGHGLVIVQEGYRDSAAPHSSILEGLALPANAEVLFAVRVGEGRVVQCRVESQDRIDVADWNARLAAVGWRFDEELGKGYRVYHRRERTLVVHAVAHDLLLVEHGAF
jgi:hypothetical protein